jgi:hypothetical protein
MPYSDSGYLDPIHIVWRKGTPDDPYIDKSEFLKVVNQKIVLTEIPDKFTGVAITGMREVNYDRVRNKSLAEDEFYVNYSTGEIQVHASKEGKTLNVFYKGRGFIQYPSERIYYRDKNNNIVETLEELITESKSRLKDAENKTDVFVKKIEEVDNAVDKANQATDNANRATEDARIATDLALDAYETTRLVFKPYVQTYNELLNTYPNPEIGWTTMVYETGVRYRWDGIDWIPIDLFGGAVPKASDTIDGLMSKDDYKKLQSFPVELKDRVLTFVFPSYLSYGIQGVLARFPFNGTIVGVRAFCGTVGITDTLINVEKSTDLSNWTSILSNNIRIVAGNHFDDGSVTISNTTVNQGDIFRVNVLQNGSGIKDVTVEVRIKI